MSRPALLAALLAVGVGCAVDDGVEPGENLPGGDTTNTLLFGRNAFTMPAANITAEHETWFLTGNSFFNQPWVQAPASTTTRDGLGPVFNARSCSACHFKDGRGAPPVAPDEAFLGMLLRLSVDGAGEHGAPLPDPSYGGQLQPFGINGVPGEGMPRVSYDEVAGRYDDGTAYTLLAPRYRIDELAFGPLDAGVRISPRVAPATIGLGLLEAIPRARLEELADPDDRDGDGISGRINQVWDVGRGAVVEGRFGWKAEQPTVRQQSAGAFLGDMGITSPVFPEEDCPPPQAACREGASGGSPEIEAHLFERVVVYSMLLAVPARARWDDEVVLRGKALFADAGCAGCHTPNHTTGAIDGLPELTAQSIWPYTDLLLHDMGEGLSDGRPSYAAEGSEWRTPPLWGVGRYRDVNDHERLLHDGRARGVAEAILWHGGEGEAARDAFRAMSADERAALIEFVESL